MKVAQGMGHHFLHQQPSGSSAHRRTMGERHQRHSSGRPWQLHRNISQPAESLFHSSGTDDGRPVRHARGNLPADENPGKPAGTNQKTAQTLRHHLHCPDHPARGGHPAVRAARSGRPGTLPLDLRNRCPGSHFHRVHLDIHPPGTVRAGPLSPPAPPWAA